MTSSIGIMREKGKFHDDNGRSYGKVTLKQIEREEANRKENEYRYIDRLYEAGKCDLGNPPTGVWVISFKKWALGKFGLERLANSLMNGEFKGRPEAACGRLEALGVSKEEIEAALSAEAKLEEPEAAEQEAEPQPEAKPSRVNRDTLSKVMTLGNKLAAKGNDRSAAFVRAWQIVKAGGLELTVRGVSFGSRQEALKRLAAYDPAKVRAFLLPEVDNPADGNAIAVMCGVQGGRGYYKLGYVPAGDTRIAASVRGRASIRVLPGEIYGARLALAV